MPAWVLKAAQLLLTYFIVPLFSKWWANHVAEQEMKKAEDQRNAEIDKALQDFEAAVNLKEKTDAFKRLIRRRPSKPAE